MTAPGNTWSVPTVQTISGEAALARSISAYQGIIPQMHGCTACMVGAAGNRHAVAHDTYNAACQADLRPLRLQKSPLLNVQLQIALILG